MPRFTIAVSLLLAMPLGIAQAASLQNYELTKTLEKVAKESSVGTPRAINEDIIDSGYTVKGNELINHLEVRASHAVKMRENPRDVYLQLGASVCRNPGYQQLMAQGAVMRYDFTEYKTKKPVTTQRYTAADCGKKP
ncbi:quorum-sensing-regulated virulence factor family protein [Pseudomonas sp. RIT-PI-S]|uniref:quorum-sensing-regulated virulence factor family protein n=1 Tax=Pseudomonas sp. RIT-PI-S TaxID=3035295 RepID=UPI0021D7DDE7|nr:quorum-sensing-regulated virulence factor family protein [Pseudomonas sp. RIT-PI-S]